MNMPLQRCRLISYSTNILSSVCVCISRWAYAGSKMKNEM